MTREISPLSLSLSLSPSLLLSVSVRGVLQTVSVFPVLVQLPFALPVSIVPS